MLSCRELYRILAFVRKKSIWMDDNQMLSGFPIPNIWDHPNDFQSHIKKKSTTSLYHHFTATNNPYCRNCDTNASCVTWFIPSFYLKKKNVWCYHLIFSWRTRRGRPRREKSKCWPCLTEVNIFTEHQHDTKDIAFTWLEFGSGL